MSGEFLSLMIERNNFAVEPDRLSKLADERYSHHSKEKAIQVAHLFCGVIGGLFNTDLVS